MDLSGQSDCLTKTEGVIFKASNLGHYPEGFRSGTESKIPAAAPWIRVDKKKNPSSLFILRSLFRMLMRTFITQKMWDSGDLFFFRRSSNIRKKDTRGKQTLAVNLVIILLHKKMGQEL